MKSKLLFGVGIAAGYVLGSRSGRAAYDKLKARAAGIWDSKPVQDKVAAATEVVKEKAPEVGDQLSEAARRAGTVLSSAMHRDSSKSGDHRLGRRRPRVPASVRRAALADSGHVPAHSTHPETVNLGTSDVESDPALNDATARTGPTKVAQRRPAPRPTWTPSGNRLRVSGFPASSRVEEGSDLVRRNCRTPLAEFPMEAIGEGVNSTAASAAMPRRRTSPLCGLPHAGALAPGSRRAHPPWRTLLRPTAGLPPVWVPRASVLPGPPSSRLAFAAHRRPQIPLGTIGGATAGLDAFTGGAMENLRRFLGCWKPRSSPRRRSWPWPVSGGGGFRRAGRGDFPPVRIPAGARAAAVDRTRTEAINAAGPASKAAGWTTGWGHDTERRCCRLGSCRAPLLRGCCRFRFFFRLRASRRGFGSPADDGCRNTAEFLRTRLRIGAGEARRRLALASAVLPRTGITGQPMPPACEETAAALADGVHRLPRRNHHHHRPGPRPPHRRPRGSRPDGTRPDPHRDRQRPRLPHPHHPPLGRRHRPGRHRTHRRRPPPPPRRLPPPPPPRTPPPRNLRHTRPIRTPPHRHEHRHQPPHPTPDTPGADDGSDEAPAQTAAA